MGFDANYRLEDSEVRAATQATAGMSVEGFNALGSTAQREAQHKYDLALKEHQRKADKEAQVIEASGEIYQTLEVVATRRNQRELLLDDKPDHLRIELSSPLDLASISKALPKTSEYIYNSQHFASQEKDEAYSSANILLKGIEINQTRPGDATLEYILGDQSDPTTERRIGIRVVNKAKDSVLGTTWRNTQKGIDHDGTDRNDYTTKEYADMAQTCREVKRYITANLGNEYSPVTLTSE